MKGKIKFTVEFFFFSEQDREKWFFDMDVAFRNKFSNDFLFSDNYISSEGIIVHLVEILADDNEMAKDKFIDIRLFSDEIQSMTESYGNRIFWEKV